MDNEMDNDYFDPAFTREDLNFGLSLQDQFAFNEDDTVPFIDPVSGEFMGEISGAEADALTWMNSDTLGYRAFGGAEDQDVAENRITMGQDDWMGAVKYDLRWRGFRNTTSDIIQHYGIDEIPALAMLNDIAGETTRRNESVRLGGTPGAIFGEQNIPGLRSGPVGSEQTIFDMMLDTGGNVMESLGFFDKSIMGIVASGAGLHSNLVDMSPDRLAPTTREKLLPMMVAAARVMNPGQNTDLLDAASNGDPEAFDGLYNMLKATRLTMGEADFGAATLISHLDEFTDFTQQAKEVGLIEYSNSAQLDLSDTITQVFLVRQTQDLGINGAYAFINGKTPEERAAGLGAVASASTVFGPDFFQQSIAFVSEKDFKPNEGWAKLDDKRRGFLEANGITLDVLIEGGAQIRNQATLLFLADAEIMHIVGHKNRTRLFNKEYGEGSWWGATTRFGGDMYRGMADDPMAQFDMTVGLATGGAGAIRFSARKLAGATFWSNTGRFLVENAVAEGTLGVISGYAASADAQTRLFDRGSTSVQVDSSLQAEDAAFVGAMSAGFSVAIPVVLGGAVKGTAKAVGGTLRASERGGLLGIRAQEMREAHDLSRMLSSDDLHHALLYGQIPPEVAVRAIASDSAALDIVSTFIKRHVEKNGSSEGWDVHSIEAMLDAGELARHGMSRVEVVNIVMAIATDLGKDGKIGAAELDALIKGYLIQRAEATLTNVKADPKAGPTKRAKVSLEELAQGKRGETIDEPASTVTRAERLQIAMAQRDAEAAANFATSQRVTSDPSPKQRRKAENTMASLTRGEEVSRGDVKSLIETITAMRDGRAIDSAISFLLGTDMKAYLSDDQLGKIIQDLSEMKIAGRKAIDADPTLRRAIELRAVMTNVANDLTTRSASGLGMTTRQIAKFINAYIATAGNTVQRAKLLNDNPVGKSVIDKLYEDGGVKTLLVDEGRASYDFAAFRRSEEYADIRAVRASRTKLANDINSARAKFSRSSEDLAKALNDIRKNAEKNLREKYNKLGVDDYDAVTAIERMETDAKTFENLTAVERRLLMSNALTRLVDRVDPELVSPTGTNADRVSLTHMFENTPIADKLEALLARVALFPQSQARLFRSNMRLIRAGAQFIGNQHIGRRRYGSRADLSSIEGVANAAMMETIGVRRAARDMAIKLGSKAYNQFQSALQQLRIRGLLVDDTPAVRAALTKMIAEQMPELLKKYNGNATTMLDDMFNLNNKMTDYFQRVFENAKRNGSMQSSGVDPRKYVPHNLNSRLSATQRADFVKSMAALKQKQYEEDGSQLVLDALVELGWLRRETTKSEVVLEGPNVSVQQINYTVPEDSPFRGISGKTVADDAAYVIKNAERGRAFLTELQDKILTPEAPKPKNAKKRPKKSAVGDDTVTPGTKTEATEPLTPEGQPTPKPIASKPNASERGNASAGDVMRPISRTAEEDGRANFISDLIHHSDPELQVLNKRLASIQAIDRENLTDSEIAALIIRYDSALKEVSVRVDQLIAEGDRLLDEAGEVPQGSLRSDMDANDISAAIMDKTLYDAISPSHKALRHNYDELVAQGVLTRESADMVLAAFADIPALKLIGITIRNNDSFLSRASTVFHYNRTLRHELYALAHEGNPNVKSVKGHRGSDTMRSLEQEMEDDTTLGAMHPDAISSGGNYPRQLVLDGETIADSVKRNKAGGVANRETSFELEGDVHGDNHDFVSRVLLHEVGHMLFADAPRELKLAVQELYAREVQSTTNGEGRGPIAQLFENLGYSETRIEYGFSNVHEFVAVLAELSLFNNRTMRTTASISAGSNSAILRVLASITNAFKQIIRKFVKDSDKLMVVARQTEGLDEVKMRALLDTVYAMAHGRKTQIRHAARLDEVFGLNYDRDKFAVNRYVDRTFWADTSDELGVDWREVQSRTDVEAENTSEIPEFLIDSGRTSMSSFAMTSPRLFAEYAERLGIEPDVLLRRDRGDRLLQTIAETDEGNIRLSPGDFKLAEDMLLDQLAIVDEMLDTATGKNIYSKIVERFGNSGESIFDLMRDRAWIKSRANTLDSDGTYLQEWEITDALNGLEKAMTIRDEADKSLTKLYNSEKKEPDTYSAIVDKFGAMFEEGFRTVDELASDFPNEAMAYLQRVRELDLKNGGKGSLTQNQQDLMVAARDELDARKEANRLQREGRITRAEEQVTNAKEGDTVRITDADLELLENRLHDDIGAAFDMRDAKSFPEMALAIAELEKVFGRTMNELVDIINNTDSLSFVTGEQKLIKLFEDSETQGYTPDDFERFREVIDEFIEIDARANQAKEVIEKIERITIDNTASSNIRPLRSKVTSGLSEDDRLMLEALQAAMKQGDLTGPQEQLLRELGDKVMAAENPAVKPTKTKSKNDQWHLRLAEQDQAFQEDLMGAEGIYYGHLNGDIRDSTMAELVDNNGVHTLKSGGRAGESTDVLGLFRAMKDKSLSKEERQGKKRLFLAWVKNAKSSYVSQQISVKKVSEENKTSVALQEQTRLANRESTERPTPGVWVGQIKEKDQDGDSVYGMWEGLRNAARQSSDEETALDIERGLAMIDLLGEFGDELYSAGLISSTPAKRLTDFVASSVDFTGKSNKQIADIRKVYSPTFWVGDKLTGKKSTPEGRELLERIRTAAVERGFGAGGNLGSFTVAVHVRQPATVLEKMYAASADMSKRGILPAAEEAAPVTKPVKAADTGITKASDDANSTGEVGKIAPGSNIDKEGLVKIAEAASDYNEFSRLVRTKYGDEAVDGEHFDIVDDYYNRLNPEVVEAKDTIAEILNIRLYHGGTWDGKTKMRAFTHFGTERSAASDRINEKGPMGEYADDAELTISELDLREDAVILSFRDNGEPHETPTGVIEATINAVLNHLAKSRGVTDGIKLEISRLHARAEYIRTEMFNTVSELSRAGDPEAESLMRMVQSAQQEIMDEYAALLTREGIDGFRYWNSSEGDAPNWSMMMVNDRALVKPEEGAVPRLAEQKPPSQSDLGPNRPDLATVPKKEARADVEATLSRGDSKPMAEKSDVEAVEALEDMPPVEAENAIVNMDGEQAKRVAAEAEAKQAELAKAKADAESLSDQQLTKKAEAALYDMSVEEFDRAFDDWPGGTEALDGFDGDLKAYVKAYDQRLWKAIKNVESLRMQINRGELNPENVTPEQLRTLKNDMAVMSTGDSYADTEMFMMDVDFTFMGKPLTANVDFTNAGYRILGYLDGSHKNSGLGPVSDAPYNGPRVEPNDNSAAKLAYLDLTEKMKDSVIQVVLYRGVASETLSESGGAVLRDGDFEPTGPGFFSSQFGLNVETHSAETGNFMANRPMDADMHAGDGVVVPMFVDIRKPFFAYKHAYPGYTNAELRAMGYDAIIFSSDASSGFDMMRAGNYTELNYIGDLDKVYSAVSGLSFGKNRAPVSVEIEPTTKAMADVEAGYTPGKKVWITGTLSDASSQIYIKGTAAYHGGTWDGITTMRDFTHFGTERSAASDRINEKGPMGEYAEDAELQIVERFLKPETRLLEITDNSKPHQTPEEIIDATRRHVFNYLDYAFLEDDPTMRPSSPQKVDAELDGLYDRAKKLREGTMTPRELDAAQAKILGEYAAILRRENIHGFKYVNTSEGDALNWSFMLADQSRLEPKRDAAAIASAQADAEVRAVKLNEEYAALTDDEWIAGPGAKWPKIGELSDPEESSWFNRNSIYQDNRNIRNSGGIEEAREAGDFDYDRASMEDAIEHATDILYPTIADFLNRIHSGELTPENITAKEISNVRAMMRMSTADVMYEINDSVLNFKVGFFGDNKELPGAVDFGGLAYKIGVYLQGFENPGQLGPINKYQYNGPKIKPSVAEQARIGELGLTQVMQNSVIQFTLYRGTGSRDASRWRPDVLYDDGFDGGRDSARDGNFFSPDPELAALYGDNVMPVFIDIEKPFFAGGIHVSVVPSNAELRAMGYDAIIFTNDEYKPLVRSEQMEINFIGNHDQVYSAISGQTYGESRRATPTTTTDAPEVRATTQIIEAEKAVKAAAEEEALARELGSTELPVEGSGAAVGKSIDLEDMSLKDLRTYVKDNDLNVRAKSAASLRNKIREAEKAEAITKARAGSGEGIPPKDPPKTARGADGEGEEPKPDKKPKKTKKGRSLRIKNDILDLILGRKASEKQVTPSHINPKYKGNLLEEYNAEIASGRAANARAEQYVQTQATNMSSSRINTTQGIDMDVAVKNSMNRLDNRMDREFSDADMEGPEGAELARLFGENSDIEELMVNYGRSVGTKVKLTDVMNELGGTRGYSMADFFAQMEEAGMAILETDAKTGKRNLRATEAEADAFKNYIGQLKHLYLQTLGYNVSKFDKNTALSRGLQVAQNLVYSRLGGTFSASVVLTEGPMNLLRTGGLGPAQLLKNGTTLITGIAQIIGGVTARNIPGMSKFMSALGLDVKRMRYIGEDIVMAMENNNRNALSKFGLAEDAEAGNAAIHSVKGRVAAHGRRILAGGGDVTEDDRFLGGLTARVEATTAAAADLTGVASGMSQVISLVKSMAISIGQNVLVRHGDGLIRMGDAMAKIKDPLTRKQLIDLGRTHKVPKQAVILAAEAGLLSDGASTLKIMKHELGINYGRGGSRGRDLDLQELQDAINARRENRTYSEAGGMGLDELQARQAEIDDKAVGQVQNFLLLFAQQGSPELKGSMKFTAGDPLRSFLFAMTSYPMAAYQHLVANGVATKSGAAAYGTLSALVVLEYNNRLLQQMLYGKDEETKKKALDKLQRVYSGDIETEDIVEVLAMYGTMSPAFGAWGKYSKDLLGLPIATAAGVDTSGHFRANPFLGPVGGTISNMYGKAISPLTKMQSDSTAKRERSLSNFISTAIDAGTPLNNATFQALSSNLTGKRIGDLIGEIAVKGDMAGRAGSPGGSAPNFARGRGSRWYSQRRQPDSLSDTPNFNRVVDTFLPKIPPPVEPQQATQPPASPNPLTAEDLVRSGKGSASSSLADMLQQRKQ